MPSPAPTHMEWYYAIDGQRQGPVSTDEFARLVAAGTVTDATLVWRAGMAAWQPWREVAPTESLPPVSPVAPTSLEPAPTWHPVSTADPETTEPLVDAETFWQRLRANGYATSVGSCLSRAWSLYSAAFFPCLGVTLLAYLIMMVAANVPLAGIIAQFLVVPQLTAGLFWYFLRRVRGERAELNDIFVGFQRGFGQLALVALIQFAILLPVIIVMMVAGFGFAAAGGAAAEGTVETTTAIGFAIGMVLVAVLVALLMFRLILAHLIVVDRGETAMAALKLSWRMVGLRYLTLLGLALVLALIGMAGMLALIIGALFVLPLFPAAFAYAYEDAVQSANTGPTTA